MTELRYNNQYGILGAPQTSGSTTITFAVAPDFKTITSPDYIKLVVGTANNFEIQYLTAYTQGNLTGTVTRAAEDSTNWPAVAHGFGTSWVHSPTVSDYFGNDEQHLSQYALTTTSEFNAQMAINKNETGAGGSWILPQGQLFDFVGLSVPTITSIRGLGPYYFGSCIQIFNGTAADGITMWSLNNPSPNASNAFYCTLSNFMVDIRGHNAPDGSWNSCLVLQFNDSFQGGDPEFDTHHHFERLFLKNSSGEGMWHHGRSECSFRRLHISNGNGTGIVSSYDSFYDMCSVTAMGLAGMYINHSDVKLVGCNLYNNGTMTPWTSGLNWTEGQNTVYNGLLYYAKTALTNDTTAPPSDSTNWGTVSRLAFASTNNAPEWGNGLYLDSNASRVEISALGVDQNASNGIYMKGAQWCNIQARVSNINTGNGGGTTQSSNPNNYAALVLDGALNNNITLTTAGLGPAGYVLRIINNAAGNNVSITTDGSQVAIFTSDSVVGNNRIEIDGKLISGPDAVNAAATSATPYVLPDAYPEHLITLTHTVGATALTLPTATTGKRITVGLKQDSTGGVSWTLTGAKWVGGSAPSPTTSASALDIVSLVCLDGSTWSEETRRLNVH